MDILSKHYPNEDHVLIYDNATTHQKRAPNGLSASKMPKNIPKPGTNWGVEVPQRDVNGRTLRGTDGKPITYKASMTPGRFSDGRPQSFYFPPGHPRAGIFKGMAVILEEHGYSNATKLLAQCPNFKCKDPDNGLCCCRRILYQEPDFEDAPSLLKELGGQRGFPILFLPKFHCELNFIEMVWGRAKYWYRRNPPSSREDDLEANMINALEAVSLAEMQRYAFI